MQRLLREPLLHFFVLGAIVFALYGWVNRDASNDENEIVVDAGRAALLRSQFERTRQRPPTPEEQAGLLEGWVRQEVLYREGVALGMDEDDSVIRRRVAQKMMFMAEAMADASPTDEELQAWLDANPDRYRLDARFTLRQVFVDPERHGDELDAVVTSLRTALNDRDANAAGDTTLLPDGMAGKTLSDIARIFGVSFAQALGDLAVGEWHGPVDSTYGLHFVWIEEASPGRTATLDEVRANVERDLLAERTRTAADRLYEALLEKYTVRYPDGGPEQSALGATQ
ncbi:MAG: peptidylprolyl isomerase [Pseudomonadota bacterium]